MLARASRQEGEEVCSTGSIQICPNVTPELTLATFSVPAIVRLEEGTFVAGDFFSCVARACPHDNDGDQGKNLSPKRLLYLDFGSLGLAHPVPPFVTLVLTAL